MSGVPAFHWAPTEAVALAHLHQGKWRARERHLNMSKAGGLQFQRLIPVPFSDDPQVPIPLLLLRCLTLGLGFQLSIEFSFPFLRCYKVDYPYLKHVARSVQIVNFFRFQNMHTHNEMSILGMGPKFKQEIHLLFICTFAHRLKVILCTTFGVPVF